MSAQNLSVLLTALSGSWKTKELEDRYKVSELTLNQQQVFLATAFDQYEKPAKTWNAFNRVIKECVTPLKDEYTNITVLERPYLIRELRDLTLGNKIVKVNGEDKEEFTLTNISFKELDKVKKGKVIKITPEISIELAVPDLHRDEFINNQLLSQLNSMKRSASTNRESLSGGDITVMYYHYELIKFIKSITVGETVFEFKNLIPNEQLHAIKSLDLSTTTAISDFIESVKKFEQKAFTGTNKETGKSEVFQMDQTIFSKEL